MTISIYSSTPAIKSNKGNYSWWWWWWSSILLPQCTWNRTPSIINVLYYSETSTCRRKQNISIYKQVLTNRFIFLNGQPGNKWNCKFDNRVMVFKATFNNISVISWQSVLLVEETGVPGENHRPVESHWQTLSHNVVSNTPRMIKWLVSTCLYILIFHFLLQVDVSWYNRGGRDRMVVGFTTTCEFSACHL
jgi:hypothetical protein